MLKLVNVIKDKKGNLSSFTVVNEETGEIIQPLFDNYTMKEDYENAQVRAIEPMTAKESLNENELEYMLMSSDYIAEEKLDGTRATFHIGEENCRIFSRRISKHTGWYVENSDSVPQLRDIQCPVLNDTVLDGEMRIDGREFKDVSSTLNCTWDKAIVRQIELGFITLHAFDIIYYKGIYIAKMPLWKRKQYLEKAVKELNSPYVKCEPFSDTTITKFISRKDPCVKLQQDNLESFKTIYPNLFKAVGKHALVTLQEGVEVELNKKAWYEYIIANGGEGLMLKSKFGTYKHKRGREYTKWKKFLTRDCVIMGFTEPTKLYDGKFTNDRWEYWITSKGNKCTRDYGQRSAKELLADKDINGECNFIPVSKYYYNDWVGNMRFGVVVTEEEVQAWEKANKTKAVTEVIDDLLVLEVGECAGYDEEIRLEFTKNRHLYRGQVVEILANEIFTKTGKLRHPRYLRCRNDKSAEQCIWKDHIEG